jgi:hypothetical protein
MKPVSMQLIPLSTAFLCQDCNCVSNCYSQCPACASSVLMGLEPILNRKQEKRSRSKNITGFPAWQARLQSVA